MILELLFAALLQPSPEFCKDFTPSPDSPALAKNWTPDSGLEKPPWFDIHGNVIEYIGACPPAQQQLPPPSSPIFVVGVLPCVPAGKTQTCYFHLSWSDVGADGYQIQQQEPAKEPQWNDIYARMTALGQLDEIFDDPGNRELCWRVWAINSGGSTVSNEECRTSTPLAKPPSTPQVLVIKP